MDGEKIDAEAVEAWRPPVADAATDDDGGEAGRAEAREERRKAREKIDRVIADLGADDSFDFARYFDALLIRKSLIEPGDLDDIDDCDPADDEPDFVRDWVDED